MSLVRVESSFIRVICVGGKIVRLEEDLFDLSLEDFLVFDLLLEDFSFEEPSFEEDFFFFFLEDFSFEDFSLGAFSFEDVSSEDVSFEDLSSLVDKVLEDFLEDFFDLYRLRLDFLSRLSLRLTAFDDTVREPSDE